MSHGVVYLTSPGSRFWTQIDSKPHVKAMVWLKNGIFGKKCQKWHPVKNRPKSPGKTSWNGPHEDQKGPKMPKIQKRAKMSTSDGGGHVKTGPKPRKFQKNHSKSLFFRSVKNGKKCHFGVDLQDFSKGLLEHDLEFDPVNQNCQTPKTPKITVFQKMPKTSNLSICPANVSVRKWPSDGREKHEKKVKIPDLESTYDKEKLAENHKNVHYDSKSCSKSPLGKSWKSTPKWHVCSKVSLLSTIWAPPPKSGFWAQKTSKRGQKRVTFWDPLKSRFGQKWVIYGQVY